MTLKKGYKNNQLQHTVESMMSGDRAVGAEKNSNTETEKIENGSYAPSIAKNFFKEKERALIAQQNLLEQEVLIRRKKEDIQKELDERLAKKAEFQKLLAAFQNTTKK